MCSYSGLFWSGFSRIRAEYGEILRISPYLVQMWENAVQNNSQYGHFLRSVFYSHCQMIAIFYNKYKNNFTVSTGSIRFAW